ncbi:Glycosyl hydrolases family 16 [Nakamurella panacisegetis]|uniref:Glycosyl hydrolases family 16 n=1 Tax=Nakamurella panacisegetis TaxID=1090615 RepID=A0A1H0KXR3_9ACTN|nr:glycoside hydrolase family 16 protein [Nakamurella panacisegetis]SDO60586.1 Glycosyl hydrolases family 16 [Nakamurella panacisegetis]
MSVTRRLDRSGYALCFDEDFTGGVLNGDRWIDHYLPHWTTPARSAARYALTGDGLELRIDADQPAWRPEDGELRVSNLQTGSFAGPVGSTIGQHRHRPDLQVRTAVPTRSSWTPSSGLVEVTVSASPDVTCMVGIWMVGFEQNGPTESGEICIAELFGDAVGRYGSNIRAGVKAHHDPRLRTDIVDVSLDLDATTAHTYAAAWDAAGIGIYVDDDLVRELDQAITYPQQLMIDLFEFPDGTDRPDRAYPKSAVVHRVRAFEPLL